jgi:hypothetical protein
MSLALPPTVMMSEISFKVFLALSSIFDMFTSPLICTN